ncbi:MAG: CARDB domain-containing protein [Planctomycetota bacterium]
MEGTRTASARLGAWGLALALGATAACTRTESGSDEGGSASGGGAGGGGASVNADLVALSASVTNAIVEAGAPLPVSFSVQNAGPDPIGALRVAFYLSSDASFDGADVELASFSSAGLLTAATFASSGEVDVPISTAPGTWRLLLVADDDQRYAELDEANNVAVVPSTITVEEPTHPDFVVDSVSFGPSAVVAGGTIDVSHVVTNVGVEASGSFRVGVYLSSDPVVTASDFLLGQRPVTGLTVGASDSASGTVTVPTIVPSGVWYVGVLADDQGAVTEMDEFNNGASAPATLSVSTAPLPDLVPTLFTIGQVAVDAGQPFTVNDAVLNQGPTAAQAFQVGVFLSEDAEIDPAQDVLAGTRTIAALAAGASDPAGPWAVTVPGNTPGGTYFVGVLVDSADFVAESSESNNALVATAQIDVTVPPLPDLVVTAFTTPGPSTVDADGTAPLGLQFDVVNTGVVPAPATTATVYLSPDAAISFSDIALGSVDVPALDVGAGAGRTTNLTVPGGIPSGSYRVGLWIDATELVPELDEGNNLLVEPGLLDVVGDVAAEPNLVAELIDSVRTSAAPGDSFQVVTRVGNSGDLSSPAFRIVTVLSTDDVIEGTDTVIGSRLVPFGLGGGFASVASGPVNVPSSLPDGTYYLGVFADADDSVVEPDESDNGLAASGTFEVRTPPPPAPNLVVSSVTVPAGVSGAGAVFDVQHEVRNSGDLDAGSFRVGIYLSEDDAIETSDTLLATRVVTALAAGGTSSAPTAAQIPPGTPAGTWYVGVIVDDTDSVAESNEGDNGRTAPETVDV